MACARCDFYLPKNSSITQLMEAIDNLQRMLAQIPLTDDERPAVEHGTVAVDRLNERPANLPTPASHTQIQLAQETSFIPLSGLFDPKPGGTGRRRYDGNPVKALDRFSFEPLRTG